MKVFRSGRTSNRWNKTDAKSLKTLLSAWKPGKVFPVDGTIDKGGMRHTDFGIEIESKDIVALHTALLQYQTRALSELKKEFTALEKENESLEADIDRLENIFRKISALATRRRQAPNLDVFVDTIEKIADHYSYSFSRKTPLRLMKWAKWKSS